MFSNSPSLADIAAVTGRNNNDGGFADGNGWWVLIILFALFGGWGNGWGGNGNSGGGTSAATQADIQRGFDTQSIIGKLDGINNGICSLGYDQLAQMNTINQNVSNTGFAIQQAINADTVANMQNTNALASQLQQCCCDNREAIQGVNYNLATQACAINTSIANSTRDIVDSQNANTQAVLAKLTNMEMNAKDSQIAQLTADNQALRFNASQTAQNAYLVNQLRPYPVPSFPAENMYGYMFNSGVCNGIA